jgi:hypothetical protein
MDGWEVAMVLASYLEAEEGSGFTTTVPFFAAAAGLGGDCLTTLGEGPRTGLPSVTEFWGELREGDFLLPFPLPFPLLFAVLSPLLDVPSLAAPLLVLSLLLVVVSMEE